jgi:hypothetical protein
MRIEPLAVGIAQAANFAHAMGPAAIPYASSETSPSGRPNSNVFSVIDTSV